MAKTYGNTRKNAPSSNPNMKGAGNTSPQYSHSSTVMSFSNAIDYIKSITGISDDNEAGELYWAINDFTGSYSDSVREASRGETTSSNSLARLKNIEKFIELAPKWNGGTTWRGLELSRDAIDSFSVGMIVDNMGPASWSSEREVAEGFTNMRNKFFFRCEKPQNGTSVKFASLCPSEDEVLCSERCRYRITNITSSTDDYGNVTIVDVEPVVNKPKRK